MCIRVATIVPRSVKSCQAKQHILVYLLLLLLQPAMRLFVWNSHDLRPITSFARVDVYEFTYVWSRVFLGFFSAIYLFIYLLL